MQAKPKSDSTLAAPGIALALGLELGQTAGRRPYRMLFAILPFLTLNGPWRFKATGIGGGRETTSAMLWAGPRWLTWPGCRTGAASNGASSSMSTGKIDSRHVSSTVDFGRTSRSEQINDASHNLRRAGENSNSSSSAYRRLTGDNIETAPSRTISVGSGTREIGVGEKESMHRKWQERQTSGSHETPLPTSTHPAEPKMATQRGQTLNQSKFGARPLRHAGMTALSLALVDWYPLHAASDMIAGSATIQANVKPANLKIVRHPFKPLALDVLQDFPFLSPATAAWNQLKTVSGIPQGAKTDQSMAEDCKLNTARLLPEASASASLHELPWPEESKFWGVERKNKMSTLTPTHASGRLSLNEPTPFDGKWDGPLAAKSIRGLGEIVDSIEVMVQREVTKATKRQHATKQAQAQPQMAAHKSKRIRQIANDDEVIQALIKKMRVLAQQERFRTGKLR